LHIEKYKKPPPFIFIFSLSGFGAKRLKKFWPSRAETRLDFFSFLVEFLAKLIVKKIGGKKYEKYQKKV